MKKLIPLLLILLITAGCKEDFSTWRDLNESWFKGNEAKLGDSPYVLNSGVLPGGVQYEIYHQGYGAIPKPGLDPSTEQPSSYVVVKYEGWLVDGTLFDSSESAGFYMTQVITGWQDALAQMRQGSHWKIYIPWGLGYGSVGSELYNGNYYIPPYSTLIFDVELLEVVNY